VKREKGWEKRGERKGGREQLNDKNFNVDYL
jgi:hypothetical protein